jgi:hypothetical protein
MDLISRVFGTLDAQRQGSPPDRKGGGYVERVGAHQDHVGSLDGDVGAADGDAEVSLGEGRGVVDAVADHGDLMTGPLRLRDLVRFVAGQDLGGDRSRRSLRGHAARPLMA